MVSSLYIDEDRPRPLASVVQSRVSETEIHHFDLGTRYTFNDPPPELGTALMERYAGLHTDAKMEPCTRLSSDTSASWSFGNGTGPTLRGTSGSLPAGRSGGSGVVADAGARLPTLPSSYRLFVGTLRRDARRDRAATG